MQKMPRRTRRNDAGFTLIDMLFVVALIGLLASMAIPGLMKARGAAQASVRPQTFREALGEAFGYRSYILLVIGFFTCGFHVAFITTHLPPYLVDKGLDAKWGGWVIALIGLFNIIGSISAGILGAAAYQKPRIGALTERAVIALIISAFLTAAAVLVLNTATDRGLFGLEVARLVFRLASLAIGFVPLAWLVTVTSPKAARVAPTRPSSNCRSMRTLEFTRGTV